ncbi:hypothetical protein EYC80_008160 [Monilinia laxa]|uniref:Uncharacterized protein n=1 Tax=Monilinia laxa TaxID=61186 RepID=A0A5N6JV70_MONLA|nr:hypothetical protein EYC80_008160 [Monilinia laxa]
MVERPCLFRKWNSTLYYRFSMLEWFSAARIGVPHRSPNRKRFDRPWYPHKLYTPQIIMICVTYCAGSTLYNLCGIRGLRGWFFCDQFTGNPEVLVSFPRTRIAPDIGFSSFFPSLLIEPTRGGSLSHVVRGTLQYFLFSSPFCKAQFGSSLKDIVLDNSQDHASFKVFFMNHRYPALQSTMIESSYSSTLT